MSFCLRGAMAYKGKVKKDQFDVIIRTTEEKIEGKVYLVSGVRLLDMLNNTDESYVAVSEAKVYSLPTEKLIFEAEFLALNKKQIVLIAESYTLPPI